MKLSSDILSLPSSAFSLGSTSLDHRDFVLDDRCWIFHCSSNLDNVDVNAVTSLLSSVIACKRVSVERRLLTLADDSGYIGRGTTKLVTNRGTKATKLTKVRPIFSNDFTGFQNKMSKEAIPITTLTRKVSRCVVRTTTVRMNHKSIRKFQVSFSVHLASFLFSRTAKRQGYPVI